jgi:hypothetical protein
MVNFDLVEFGVFTHELETGPGRNSVRIKSKSTYTTHVVVANINHMPQVSMTGPKEILFFHRLHRDVLLGLHSGKSTRPTGPIK